MGSPAKLAEQYRQQPRYLISPAMYDDYIQALKVIIPLVGVILLVVGMVLGVINSIKDGLVPLTVMITNMIAKGLSMGISGAFQALFWTTVGFVIADKTGAAKEEEPWRVGDLPDEIPVDGKRIPLSDCIVELILTTIGTIFLICLLSGVFPRIGLSFSGDAVFSFDLNHLFADEFVRLIFPLFIISCIVEIGTIIIKIIVREWKPVTCITTVINNIFGVGIMIAILFQKQIFSAEFIAYVESNDWGTQVGRFLGSGYQNPVVVCLVLIVVICAIFDSVRAIRKTYFIDEETVSFNHLNIW